MTCFTAAEFLALIQNLLPPGPAFPRDPNSVQTQLFQALADAQETTGDRICNLLVDAFPSTTTELLPEWQLSVGLPDPCSGPDATIEQRRAHLLAKLLADGGQSLPYLLAFATRLGFPDTTFKEFSPFRVGMYVGQPLYGCCWAYALQVNNPLLKWYFFQTDINVMGDPLSHWDSPVLICELRRIVPGHVTLVLNFIKVFHIVGSEAVVENTLYLDGWTPYPIMTGEP